MEKKKKCSCSGEFNAETAFRRLSKKYNDLVEVLSDHLAQTDESSLKRTNGGQNDLAALLIRIIGGKAVPEGAYPECCLIGARNMNGTVDWFCTGVLIHPRIVVTAGHCYKPEYSFVVALNTINQNALSNAEIISIKKAVPHLGYQQTKKFNDITVLVLAQAAQTPPVQLASSTEINAAARTTLVGFGNDDTQSTIGFGIKREVSVDIKSIRRHQSDNLDQEEGYYDYESDIEFVAGGNGYDSCNGDSGGPAYIMVEGVRKLAGLTSRATAHAQEPCGEGGIYTRIDVQTSFIAGLTPG